MSFFDYWSRGARGLFSFEAQKKQNACQQTGFFHLWPLRTSRENLDCNILPRSRAMGLHFRQNLLCPATPPGHHCFPRFWPKLTC